MKNNSDDLPVLFKWIPWEIIEEPTMFLWLYSKIALEGQHAFIPSPREEKPFSGKCSMNKMNLLPLRGSLWSIFALTANQNSTALALFGLVENWTKHPRNVRNTLSIECRSRWKMVFGQGRVETRRRKGKYNFLDQNKIK